MADENTQEGTLNKNTVAYVREQVEQVRAELNELVLVTAALNESLNDLKDGVKGHVEIFNKHIVDLHVNS